MSHKQHNTNDAQDASSGELEADAPKRENEGASAPQPSSEPQNGKKAPSVLYGTRKRRPGAEEAAPPPSIQQYKSLELDEEITEMDDLPVRATAPKRLIADEGEEAAGERPKRRRRADASSEGKRPRGDRRRESRKGRPESPQGEGEPAAEPSAEEDRPRAPKPRKAAEPAAESRDSESAEGPVSEEERPERFGSIDVSKRRSSGGEFRPSRDGRVAERKPAAAERSEQSAAPDSSKGLLGWVKSLFGSEVEPPQPEPPPPPQPQRGGGQGGGGQGGRRRRSRGGSSKGGGQSQGQGQGARQRSQSRRGGRGRRRSRGGRGGAKRGARE